eukprot:gnl/TRDRNA2_/TRDRNA2_141341_c1_seq1.p1 gnl/TRDRNA2_/TRDRNA2_141341_c1~~gnl/TRDRNA2_/TRDRNA2_141341_c1_seq1.p1  ORF type:complete len:570 (+),score=103.96 gnl/TRDRNA2_/TRDRNA2_141341_c1_seq1:86-1711(+)
MILDGLGFDSEMQQRPTREFSGGWRMRVALAQALFLRPDLLLLDEPTNHLDVVAMLWLEEFLNSWDRTVVIVSHDRGFLNAVTTATIHLHHKQLIYYNGNYDTFVKVRAEQRKRDENIAKSQNQKISHLKDYVRRFQAATGKLAAQAQSRMKMLKKLEEEVVEVDTDDASLHLDFPAASPLSPPCVSIMDVSFNYDGSPILYEELNFGLDCESRVAIVGPNGAGKSTFLKLVSGELMPQEGWISRNNKLRLAMFSQHSVEKMNVENNALTHMLELMGGDKEASCDIQLARNFLGKYGVTEELATKPIKFLSGGQKSRVAFAELAYRVPHILLLDEPTNHLDIETIDALAFAINNFEGGVVLVSHDERLIGLTCNEIWCVNKGEGGKPGHVKVFHGSYEEYCSKLKVDMQKSIVKEKEMERKRKAEAKKAARMSTTPAPDSEEEMDTTTKRITSYVVETTTVPQKSDEQKKAEKAKEALAKRKAHLTRAAKMGYKVAVPILDISSVACVALIGLCTGSGILFVMLGVRRSASTACMEDFLVL